MRVVLLLLAAEWTPFQLPCEVGSQAPDLCVGPEGRLGLVWIASADDHRERAELRHAEFDGDWTPADPLPGHGALFVNWADTPRTARSATHTIVAWPEKTGGGTYAYGLRFAMKSDSGGFGVPSWLHEDRQPTEHGFVSIIPRGEGFLAVWLDGRALGGDQPRMQLRARSISPEGELGSEVLIDGMTCECCATSLVDTERGVFAAYRDRTRDEVRDNMVVRFDGRDWGRPIALARDHWVIRGCPVNGPALAPVGGQLAAAWFSGAGGVNRVFATTALTSDAVALGEAPLGRLAATGDNQNLYVAWLDAADDGWVRVASIDHKSNAVVDRWSVSRIPTSRASGIPRLVIRRDALILVTQNPSGDRVVAFTMPLNGG